MTVLDPPILKTDEKDINSDICSPKIQIHSLYGCKVSGLETFEVFFNTYYWVFAILCILFGVYNILLGGKMFRVTILLFGIISTVAFVFFLLFFILEIEDMSQLLIWLWLFSSISLGAVIGYFMTRIIKVGVCVIGWWTGLVFAILLDSLIFNRFHMAFFLYFLIAIFVALFGLLAYKYYQYVLIFSSAILGSYFLVRGSSLLIGGYPNEMDLLDQLKHGTFIDIPWSFYLYLLFIVAFSIFGVIVQVKKLNKKKNKKKSKKKGSRKLRIKKNKVNTVDDSSASASASASETE